MSLSPISALTLCAAVLLSACPTAARPTPIADAPREAELVPVGEPVAIAPQFSSGPAEGCVAKGDTEEVRGTIIMHETSKGRTLVILDDGDVKWLVSYSQDGVFKDFEDFEVLARGRQCDKQGEAVKALHFEVKSMRVIK